jgi:hypothetical protein
MNGLSVIHNSEADILDAVKKMVARLGTLNLYETTNAVTQEIISNFNITSNCEIINNNIY